MSVTRRGVLRGGVASGLVVAGAAGLPAGASAQARRAQPEIAVVGAGLAGLTCAYELAKHGIGCTVYEAARGDDCSNWEAIPKECKLATPVY